MNSDISYLILFLPSIKSNWGPTTSPSPPAPPIQERRLFKLKASTLQDLIEAGTDASPPSSWRWRSWCTTRRHCRCSREKYGESPASSRRWKRRICIKLRRRGFSGGIRGRSDDGSATGGVHSSRLPSPPPPPPPALRRDPARWLPCLEKRNGRRYDFCGRRGEDG